MPSQVHSHEFPPIEIHWEQRDILLFTNSIGYTGDELHYLYEGHPNFAVFPTFAITIPFKLGDPVSDFLTGQPAGPFPGVPKLDYSRLVDGERKVTFLMPLPTSSAGRKFEVRNKIVGLYDKGKSGTVVEAEQELVDRDSGEVYSRAVGRTFFVGQGGWNGPKGVNTQSYPIPQGKAPDATHIVQTTATTPHLYRLNGDYNPLHATPEPGQKAGFGGIILHGLFTYNSAAHSLVLALGGSDPNNLKEFQARFSLPVKPGDKLITDFWITGDTVDGFHEVRFVTKNGQGKEVLKNGRALVKVVRGKSKL